MLVETPEPLTTSVLVPPPCPKSSADPVTSLTTLDGLPGLTGGRTVGGTVGVLVTLFVKVWRVSRLGSKPAASEVAWPCPRSSADAVMSLAAPSGLPGMVGGRIVGGTVGVLVTLLVTVMRVL